MTAQNFRFTDTLEHENVVIQYCDLCEDSPVAQIISRYRRDDMIASIKESLPDSFYKYRSWEVSMAHNGLVIAENNLVKVVLRDINGFKAALAIVVPVNSKYPYFGLHHLESYATKLFDVLATKYDFSLTVPLGTDYEEDYVATTA
jgi:hypothetical protein